MRSVTQLLLVNLVLAGLLGTTAAGQTAWYYHVKTGGMGGKPVQSETDPGLPSCWNSISAAFAAVKNRTTPGPWIIQVDDEATYDEAVVLSDLETSSTETLTLTKASWLAGRPTIYPRQLFQRALAINGLWPGAGDPLPDQPGQASRRITYVTVRGFTLKNNASGTERTTEETVFSDCQAYLTDGLHIIEDCLFDGQNQVYDSRNPILISGTCINTVFRRNVVQDFVINEVSQLFVYGHGNVFTMAKPLANVMGQPQITIADNTFDGNKGVVALFAGDADKQRYYRLFFERNRLIRNATVRYSTMVIEHNALSNTVQNNLFADNSGKGGTLFIYDASNTRIYHNTFFNNHMNPEVFVTGDTRMRAEIKNNLLWPTPGCYCITVRVCEENVISANNAFFTDSENDGYPPGFGLNLTENTEIVGLWREAPMTTYKWNHVSTNNTGNGYTLGGPGLDNHLHLLAGSPCIDRGIRDLVADDTDGQLRPVGGGYDIGANEYGTRGIARSLGIEHRPELDGQQLALGASIHLAAGMGDLARIEASIQESMDINKLDGRGYAPLHHAAQNNQIPAMELLIAKGGDVNVKSARGQTPLFFAIAAGHKDAAELLIAKGADINVKNKQGQTPLDISPRQNRKDIVEFLMAEALIHTAASLGDVDKVRSCLEKGADVNAKDKDGRTALHVAASNKRKEVAELLFSRGADINAKDGKDYTPLFYAIWKLDQDIVKFLVTKGADVSYTPKDDYPPLHYAVWNEDVNIVKLLVEHGAKFDVKDRDGSTALREAASQSARELLQVFILKGADVSTLPLAACMGDLGRMKALLEQGADINAKDEFGWTPLYWAVSTGQAEAAEFLVAKGADVQAKTKDEATPLHVAVSAGEVGLVELLISKGASVNIKDKRGSMPLHRAVLSGHKAIVELLIAKGADTTIPNKQGRTALDLAEQRGRTEIAEILRRHAAKE